MSERIILQPEEVWDYFQRNELALGDSMHRIAENDEYGIEIYISEEKGIALITVEHDEMEIYSEGVLNENDCVDTVREIYDDYLTSRAVLKIIEASNKSSEISDEEIDEKINEEEIEIREDEINFAVSECIDEICGGVFQYYDNKDEICEYIKEVICNILFLKYGVEPYRPMYIVYDDGSEEFEEYPYAFLEIDDKYNQIYRQ